MDGCPRDTKALERDIMSVMYIEVEVSFIRGSTVVLTGLTGCTNLLLEKLL